MKILKIFGLVVGIHVFALILIFANPGCSSTSKPTPAPSDTVGRAEAPATVSMPTFNPDAPAVASAAQGGGGIRFNPTRPNTPAANAMTAKPVEDVTPVKETYTVKAGDTLYELGKKFKIPYGDIATANNIKANAGLHPGQKLIIPGAKPAATVAAPMNTAASAKAGAASATKSSASTTPAATATSGNAMKHTVQPGESLSGIAKHYGVTLRDLGAANNISDPQKIRAGMTLVIPGWTGTSGKSAKSGTTSEPAKSTEAPKLNLTLDPNASSPAPQKSSEPPVLKVDENPLTPAPKN